MWWRIALVGGGIFLIVVIYFAIKAVTIIKALVNFHFPFPKIPSIEESIGEKK
ncbi:MAG: hypothetical protein AB7D02_03380 [Candidatus Paceibacterota bacterium]